MRHNIRFLLIVTMLLLVTGIGTAQRDHGSFPVWL